MVLARMPLPDDPADSGTVLAHEDEAILDGEAGTNEFRDQFHMRQSLSVRADLVLTLDDEDSALSKYT
jgi:hypothetical protein